MDFNVESPKVVNATNVHSNLFGAPGAKKPDAGLQAGKTLADSPGMGLDQLTSQPTNKSVG